MAEVVLAAAAPLPAVVVCDDDEVRAWAERSPAPGWCGARAAGSTARWPTGWPRCAPTGVERRRGPRRPAAGDPARLGGRLPGGDARPRPPRDGTNVLAVPTDAGLPVRATAPGRSPATGPRPARARPARPHRAATPPGVGRRPARRPGLAGSAARCSFESGGLGRSRCPWSVPGGGWRGLGHHLEPRSGPDPEPAPRWPSRNR